MSSSRRCCRLLPFLNNFAKSDPIFFRKCIFYVNSKEISERKFDIYFHFHTYKGKRVERVSFLALEICLRESGIFPGPHTARRNRSAILNVCLFVGWLLFWNSLQELLILLSPFRARFCGFWGEVRTVYVDGCYLRLLVYLELH